LIIIPSSNDGVECRDDDSSLFSSEDVEVLVEEESGCNINDDACRTNVGRVMNVMRPIIITLAIARVDNNRRGEIIFPVTGSFPLVVEATATMSIMMMIMSRGLEDGIYVGGLVRSPLCSPQHHEPQLHQGVMVKR
jgi:hypothetical protein